MPKFITFYLAFLFLMGWSERAAAFDVRLLLEQRPKIEGLSYCEELSNGGKLFILAERCEIDKLLVSGLCKRIEVRYEPIVGGDPLVLEAERARIDFVSQLVTFKGNIALSVGRKVRLNTEYLRYFYARDLVSTYSFKDFLIDGKRITVQQLLYDAKRGLLYLFSPQGNKVEKLAFR